MQINVGSLTGSTPKFLLLHLQPITFENYLSLAGIKHKTGPPYSLELNGVAKRTNRCISNTIRAALLSFKSPATILGLQPVNLSYLHLFGFLAHYKVPEASRNKPDQKGRVAILLSYMSKGNEYQLWDLGTRSVVKSCDVLFNDTVFPYGSPLATPPNPVVVKLPWPVSSPPPLTPTELPSTQKLAPVNPTPSNSSNLVRISLPPMSSPPSVPALAPSCSRSEPGNPIPAQPPQSPPRRSSGRERRAPVRYGHWSQNAKAAEQVDTPKTW
ncbi:hypothetical protein PCASD_14362 [Puccinia coronata f. sp. avenae]|uniref:Retroviral polymerase SH3-like domain-containing protein n=1 Tax=Puccinia coronata f. sp. avenae TaxID=200324 RepID=A0A2N5UCT0_9BASI|nr:hypothetical protein PCASD_14362 [Puccinia coronata f. sp. avenae]